MITLIGSQEVKGKAISLRDDLIQEQNRIGSFIGEIDRFFGSDIDLTGSLQKEQNPFIPINMKMTKIAIIQTVIEILNVRGPAKTPELLKILSETGHTVQGKRPIQTLYGVLHKDMKSANPRVRRSEDGFWCLIQTQN